MAASTALAAAGCSGPPEEPIVPYAHMPEGGPGDEPVFYASAVTRGGCAQPVLVETHTGRPTKIEGNPRHPMSGGATDAQAQAAILQLWDPDRSRTPQRGDATSSWQAATEALLARLPAMDKDGGAGLRILTPNVTSPTLLRQLDALAARYPGMRWHRHDPLHDAAAEEGARRALGMAARPLYRLDRTRVILAVGADLFMDTPASVRYGRDFSRGRGDATDAGARAGGPRHAESSRHARSGNGDDGGAAAPPGAARSASSPAAARARLYALESMPGLTGAMADQRWAMTPDAMGMLLRRLAAALGVPGADAPAGPGAAWEARLADALRREGAAALVAVGPSLPADAHALAWAINAHLGAVGQTVVPVPARPVPELGALMADMHKGAVNTLLVIDANPVYDAPALLRFADAMHRVPLSMHMGLYRDETARACTWHIPRAHELETWSDAMAWDGTPTILQPVIAPLHDGHSPHTLLQLLLDGAEHRAYELVQETWRAAWKDDFAARWAAALRSGYVEKPPPSPSTTSTSATMPNSEENDHQADHRLIAQVIPDPYLGAGAAANNAWLQELPRPLTRLTWDNAAFMGPATARAHAVATGDIVRLKAAHGGEVEAPVHVLPGHAERLVSLHLGYGRRHAGHVGDGVGFDAYAVQDCDDAGNPRRTVAVALERTSGQHRFAHVQTELSTHGRDIVRVENLQTAAAATEAAPAAAHAIEKTRTRQAQHSQPSLYPEVRYPDYAWAMTIDLDKCIGCNACTAACQVENNIPVVGAEEVRRGRAMHWIRVDVYHEKRETLVQPVPCMHCENAPCELVCPVGATVHDSEGLNAQVYNRCVGTRFCSNNCPYKVRRFNFLQYSDRSEDSAAHQNPDVTVRQRGVMEKCTYCVQRISRARIRAQEENRTLRDGEVVTACQAVCPTQAIVFGDLNDPASGVNATRASPRAYALLEELNTNPRTRYLARQADPDGRLESDDG